MEEPTQRSRRREVLADAAIEVLAHHGMRGLTHRAVDAQAGLPAGSASNHFRTRHAMLAGVVDRLAARDILDLERALEAWQDDVASTPQDAVTQPATAITDLMESWAGSGDGRLAARLTLTTEALRDPDIRQSLLAGRSRIVQLVDESRRIVARTNGRDPLGVTPTEEAVALLSAAQWVQATQGVDVGRWITKRLATD